MIPALAVKLRANVAVRAARAAMLTVSAAVLDTNSLAARSGVMVSFSGVRVFLPNDEAIAANLDAADWLIPAPAT